MEKKSNSVQREIFNFSPTTNNNKLRRIIARLGSGFSQPENSGAMVHRGKKVSHERRRAQGSQISYNVLHIKGKECNISSYPHGQNDSPVILNENVGYQKPGANCDQERNLAIPFGELQRWICLPQGYHTSYLNTNPGMSTLSVRAGMLFRYPGLTNLCMLFPRLHL